MITIEDRKKVLKIAKDWGKQGIVILVTCKTAKCKNQPLSFLLDGETRIGYICPTCKKTWVWGGED